MMPDSLNIKLKQTIEYRSINEYDTELHQGVVICICDYDIAKNYFDVIKYSAEVKGTYPKSPSATRLYYYIVKEDGGKITAIAEEWIEPGSLKIIDIPMDRTIKLYNCTVEHAEEAVRMLFENGFDAAITL